MEQFTGWDIAASAPATCGNCCMAKEKKKGCCNDAQATFQLKKDQLVSVINNIPHNQFVYIQHQYSSFAQFCFSVSDNVTQSANSPPSKPLSVVILNCVFRI